MVKVCVEPKNEMEIPITRYPWQSQNPVDYIHSFRYFMAFKNPFPANIKRVWGPAGDRGSIEWYPGNDVVDYMSIAIYGLPDKNITDPEKKRKITKIGFTESSVFSIVFGLCEFIKKHTMHNRVLKIYL